MEPLPSGLVLVTVTLNGSPVTALIDTGFPNVVVNTRVAKAMNLSVRPIGQAYSVGGIQAFGVAEQMQIAAGGETFSRGSMQVADFTGVENALGRKIDVVLGAAMIARTGLTVDFDRSRVRLRPLTPGPSERTIPIQYDVRSARFTIRGSAMGVALSPLLVDSGAESALTLTSSSYGPLASRVAIQTDYAVAGGGGVEIEKLLTLPIFDAGEVRMDRVAAEVEPPSGFLSRNGLSGSVGASFLRRYNFSLDPREGKLSLSDRQAPTRPDVKSTIGIQSDYEPDRIHVVHVMINSPAQKAGVRDGEEICGVNGQPIVDHWNGSPMRNWGVRPPGTTYHVKMCSGRMVNITSSSFY